MIVGLVGLGNLGLPICRRLALAGHDVHVHDRDAARVDLATEQSGAIVARSVAELAAKAEIVLTCLPSPSITSAVITDEEGILQACKPGTVVADLGTNDPAVVSVIDAAARSRGVGFSDCPVAGGVPGAQTGTLTVFVGGEPADVERLRPVLEAFSQRIVHLGRAGTASVAKIANNYLAFGNLSLAAEAFLFAARNGVGPAALLDALEGSSGSSAILERIARKVVPRDFSTEFAVDLAAKDLRLALGLAASGGVPMYFGGLLKALFDEAHAAGLGDEDLAAVVKVLERASGMELADEGGESVAS